MHDGIESVTRKYFKAIEMVGLAVVHRMCRIWLHFDAFFNLSTIGRQQRAALSDLHTFTNKIIRERKQFLNEIKTNQSDDDDENLSKKGRRAMLDLLLENEKLGRISMEGIREEVDTFMFEVRKLRVYRYPYGTIKSKYLGTLKMQLRINRNE